MMPNVVLQARTMPIQQVARDLVERLGASVVALLCAADDDKLPLMWAEDGRLQPTPEQEKRLRDAEEVWLLLTQHKPADQVQLWFMGSNPVLEGAPALALRRGELDRVRVAAQGWIDDSSWGL
ncbi:hypothetical protein ACRAKI_12565 [Saccharothrix isguenensis]